MSASSISAVLADAAPSMAKIAAAGAGLSSTIATMPLLSKVVSQNPVAAAAKPVASSATAVASSGNATLPVSPFTRIGSAAGASSAEYRVGFATSHSGDSNGDPAESALVAGLADHYQATNDLYVFLATPGIAEEAASKLAGYCDDNRLNAMVEPSVRRRTLHPTATGTPATRDVAMSLGLKVMDCSGEPFFSAETTAPRGADGEPGTVMLMGMLRDLIGEFDRFRYAHAGAWNSLMNTGLALDPADARYETLVGFEQDRESNTYRVTTLYPGGPGAGAGMRVGDALVAVGATPVRGLSRNAFLALLDAPSYVVSVLRPGGPTELHVRPKRYAELAAALRR